MSQSKPTPKKITAIAKMGPIRNVKGVQWPTGCLAALSRFISRLGERGMPLYRLLKKLDTFVWTEEAQQALDSLKALLTSAPVLVAPERHESLLLYSRRPPMWSSPLLWSNGRSRAMCQNATTSVLCQ
jgi:hypothetical protein